jgi:hypothetical protein
MRNTASPFGERLERGRVFDIANVVRNFGQKVKLRQE